MYLLIYTGMSVTKKIVKVSKDKQPKTKVDLIKFIVNDNINNFDDTEVIKIINNTDDNKYLTKTIVKKNKTIKDKDTSDQSNEIKEKRKYEKRSKSVIELNRELYNDNSKDNNYVKDAWKTLDEYNIPNKEKFTIISAHPGHFVTMGYDTGSLKNPYWLVKDKDNKEFYIMYCFKDTYTYFSKEEFKEIINPAIDIYPTWHFHTTGYIATKSYPNHDNTMIYLHQLVCKKYNVKERDNLSVDHINQNKLDNQHTNLRFATQSLQNENRGKRKRQCNARPLPEGVTHADIPKYVVYYQGTYGPQKKMRNWFCIEQHPKLEKRRWEGTKSMAIDIKEKLKQTKEKLEEYDKM